MNGIFSKIASGELPSYKIAENDDFYAFLDINPVKEGHTLIIPKKEIDYFFDINNDMLGKMMIFAKEIAKAIKKTFPCKKVGVAVLGLEVPHAHIHLVPINEEKDMLFNNPKLKLSPEKFIEISNKIKENL